MFPAASASWTPTNGLAPDDPRAQALTQYAAPLLTGIPARVKARPALKVVVSRWNEPQAEPSFASAIGSPSTVRQAPVPDSQVSEKRSVEQACDEGAALASREARPSPTADTDVTV